jgi:uncharacterized protein (DUF697 family)/GTP-binding protein EngB required for normal cell division
MTEFSADWFHDLFKRRFEEQARETGRFNLAIFGKTGVGKTTLLNAIFGRDEGETGIGRPVTQDNKLYKHDSGHLGVLDTRGLEIGKDTAAIIADLDEYMQKMRSEPLDEQIHVAWFCIRAGDKRFEDTEVEFIAGLRRLGLPVLIVLTQVPLKDGVYHPDALALKAHIDERSHEWHGPPAFLTYAKEDPFMGFPAHGLQQLLDATFHVAPEGVQSALTVAQKIDMERKQAEATKAIAVAAGAAASAAMVPLPFADSVALVPIQLVMMAKIAIIYNVKFDRAAAASVAATAAATAGGRALVGNLLMFVPGFGSVAGGMINATIATSFTWAMGRAWTAICARLFRGELLSVTGVLDSDAIRDAFMAEFRSSVKLTNRLPGAATSDSAPSS